MEPLKPLQPLGQKPLQNFKDTPEIATECRRVLSLILNEQINLKMVFLRQSGKTEYGHGAN